MNLPLWDPTSGFIEAVDGECQDSGAAAVACCGGSA